MNAREKRTVLIGGAVIAVAVILNLGLRPVFAAWGEARETMAAHRDRVDTLEQRLDRREVKARQLTQKYGPSVTAPLPTETDAKVSFPEATQKALRSGGMGVSSISLQGARRLRDVPGVSLLTVRVDGSVSGAKLAEAFATLRGSELLALVEDARLEKSGGGPEGPSYNVTLLLATPVLTKATR